jgi:hypothetical protein
MYRWRRLGRDYQRLLAHAETMFKWAMIGLWVGPLALRRKAPR